MGGDSGNWVDASGYVSGAAGRRGAAVELQEKLERALEQASLALGLIERGEIDEARCELERLLAARHGQPLAATAPRAADAPAETQPAETEGWNAAPPPSPSEPLQFAGDLGDSELDLAFAQAESDREQMHDANRVAQLVLDRADREASFEANDHPIFATETMADLLEGQGDREGARAIRRALHMGPQAADGEGAPAAWTGGSAESWLSGEPAAERDDDSEARMSHDARTLATLERWLDNVRRDVA